VDVTNILQGKARAIQRYLHLESHPPNKTRKKRAKPAGLLACITDGDIPRYTHIMILPGSNENTPT
jgi:hypothetical protein